MTPKEKAKNIIDKYRTFVTMWAGGIRIENQNVKQCAIIAADEIIQVIDDFEFSNHGKIGNSYGQEFWYEVKKELEKM